LLLLLLLLPLARRQHARAALMASRATLLV
jgi:hypothetical protein